MRLEQRDQVTAQRRISAARLRNKSLALLGRELE